MLFITVSITPLHSSLHAESKQTGDAVSLRAGWQSPVQVMEGTVQHTDYVTSIGWMGNSQIL